MDKKNRTGLQSKISNIFSGVPIPKKKDTESEPPKPEIKDDTSELVSPAAENNLIDKSSDEPQVVIDDLENDVYEIEISSEDQDEKLEELSETNQVGPIDSESKESSSESQPDDLNEEQFTVISDSDLTEEILVDEQKDKAEQEDNVIKIDSDENKPDDSEKEILLDKLLTPISSPVRSENKDSTLQEEKVKEPEAEEKAQENAIPSSSAKTPFIGKTAKPLNQKILKTINNQSIPVAQKPSVSKIQEARAKTENARALKKTYQRATVKKLRTKKTKTKTKTNTASEPKQKVKVAVMIILGLVLVLVLLKNFGVFSSGTNRSVIKDPPLVFTGSGQNAGNAIINWSQPPVYPEDLRDPMAVSSLGSGGQAFVSTNGFIVKGSSDVNGKWQILIGIDLYGVGDTVKGYDAKIIEIKKNSVEFESSEGETWTQIVGE